MAWKLVYLSEPKLLCKQSVAGRFSKTGTRKKLGYWRSVRWWKKARNTKTKLQRDILEDELFTGEVFQEPKICFQPLFRKQCFLEKNILCEDWKLIFDETSPVRESCLRELWSMFYGGWIEVAWGPCEGNFTAVVLLHSSTATASLYGRRFRNSPWSSFACGVWSDISDVSASHCAFASANLILSISQLLEMARHPDWKV